jgi:hypothetical protein
MTRPELIEEALKNEGVKALYDKVQAQTPISIVEDNTGTWGSITTDGQTTITATPTVRPAAALAHELLHANLKNAGYRQYTIICSMDTERAYLKPICEALDNELQHQRMIDDFVALGLANEHFYHDDDVSAFPYVRNTLKGMDRNNHPCEFLYQYFTVLAPGGVGSDKERAQLKQFFRMRCAPGTWDMLQAIETEFATWRTGTTLDAGPTIANILRHVGCFNLSWVGTSKDFPTAGHFVDAEFSFDQLVAWHEANG